MLPRLCPGIMTLLPRRQVWLCILIASLHRARLLIIHYALQRSVPLLQLCHHTSVNPKSGQSSQHSWHVATSLLSKMIPSQTVEMYSRHIDELALATHHSCLVATGARYKSILHFITGRWAAFIFDTSNCTERIATHRNLHGQLHRIQSALKMSGFVGTPAFQKTVKWLKKVMLCLKKVSEM